jgi:hypothetical protein
VNVVDAAPRIALTSVSRGVACMAGACCRRDVDNACVAWWQTYPAGSLSFGGVVVDDDGDPHNITVDGSPGGSCVGGSCATFGVVPERGPVCGNVAVSDTWSVQASDGLDGVAGSVTVTRRCL